MCLYRIVQDYIEISQQTNVVLFTWTLVTICGVMLMIQIQLVSYSSSSHTNEFLIRKLFLFHIRSQEEFISMSVLFLTIFYACYAFGVVFITCELGQRMADAFSEIDDEIDRLDWHLFPPEIQQLMPTIMMATQQEVLLECFGSINGTRETFKNVRFHILTKTHFD